MPITHIQNKEFDFSSATFEKKKDLVKILMEKQKSFTNSIRNIPSEIALQICLMFIRMICNSKFGDYCARLIPSRVISEEEFTVFFAEKLDAFLEEQAAEVSNEN